MATLTPLTTSCGNKYGYDLSFSSSSCGPQARADESDIRAWKESVHGPVLGQPPRSPHSGLKQGMSASTLPCWSSRCGSAFRKWNRARTLPRPTLLGWRCARFGKAGKHNPDVIKYVAYKDMVFEPEEDLRFSPKAFEL